MNYAITRTASSLRGSMILSFSISLLWILANSQFAKTAEPGADNRPQTEETSEPVSSKKTPAKKEKIPPALKEYKGREIAQTMHYLGAPWLVRESRQREEDCETMLSELAIQPGQMIADIGCGNGFYTLAMAKQTGKTGRVYAVDIQAEMLRLLQARAEEAEVKNIKPILGTLIDPKLPEGELDLILLVDVYHEFSHPEQMLKQIRAALKPTGRVALAEFRLEDPDVPIKLLHKMSKEQIMKEFPANGFKLVGSFDDLPWQHLMFFARDDSPLEEIPLELPAEPAKKSE